MLTAQVKFEHKSKVSPFDFEDVIPNIVLCLNLTVSLVFYIDKAKIELFSGWLLYQLSSLMFSQLLFREMRLSLLEMYFCVTTSSRTKERFEKI